MPANSFQDSLTAVGYFSKNRINIGV